MHELAFLSIGTEFLTVEGFALFGLVLPSKVLFNQLFFAMSECALKKLVKNCGKALLLFFQIGIFLRKRICTSQSCSCLGNF